ncbi:hypothetical protein I7I48_02516 [Histoplasma ohiense]|nr:hypothetical protein I7I48_02516 [Histoplasma ohiense (nom. inval.)]
MNLACPPLSHGRQWVLRMREFARIKPRSLKLRSEGVHMEVEHRPTKKKKKKKPIKHPILVSFLSFITRTHPQLRGITTAYPEGGKIEQRSQSSHLAPLMTEPHSFIDSQCQQQCSLRR